jgi:hypothetical protein
VDPAILAPALFDCTAGMDNGRMVTAAEVMPDPNQAVIGKLDREAHRHLPSPRDAALPRALPVGLLHSRGENAVLPGDCILYVINKDHPRTASP